MTPSPSMRLEKHPEPIEILYLDDELDQATALEAVVSEAFVNPVVPFHKPRDLYDYLDMHEGPFIVLVDLVLLAGDDTPTGGGYEVIERLARRTDLKATRSPIVAVTQQTLDDSLKNELERRGAHAAIHKPVGANALVAAIGRPGWFRVELSR